MTKAGPSPRRAAMPLRVAFQMDPLEGIGDDSAGDDYLTVMRANLEVLREGQGCP